MTSTLFMFLQFNSLLFGFSDTNTNMEERGAMPFVHHNLFDLEQDVQGQIFWGLAEANDSFKLRNSAADKLMRGC